MAPRLAKAEVPAELLELAIARNKAGGCRIVLPDDRAALLADREHPTNPWRLFVPTGWEELTLPVVAACHCPHCGQEFTP